MKDLAKSLASLGAFCLLGVSMSAMAAAQDPVASDDIGIINPEAAAHAFPKRGFSP